MCNWKPDSWQSSGADTIVSDGLFCGYDSIKTKEQLYDLAGVTYKKFNALLAKVPDRIPGERYKVTDENKVLINFTKKKTGLSDSALAAIFSLHRSTITTICKALEMISLIE